MSRSFFDAPPSALFGWSLLLGVALHSFIPTQPFRWEALFACAAVSGFFSFRVKSKKYVVPVILLFGCCLGFARFEIARPKFPNELRIFDASAFAYDRSVQTGWMADRRSRLTQRILQIIPDDEGRLLAGILYGERGLSKSTKDEVRRSGLSHLVAVSGANVTIILGAIMKLLAPLKWSKRQRFRAISIGLILFVLFVTPQPPVTRAAIMGWLVALAPVVGRLPNMRHLLLTAAVAFVAWRPESLLFDPSFALSFLAMIGLMTYGSSCADWIERKIKSPMLAELIGSTIGAMLLTSPYAMWAFGQLSLIGLISNLFAVPLVPWAMAIGTLVILFPFPPFVFTAKLFLSAILKIAERSAASPIGIWDEVFVSPFFMIGCYVAIAVGWGVMQKRKSVIHKKVSGDGPASDQPDKIRGLFFS
ncbi:ComEC/Rec2 family competence protein [Patescibacteria group bacterium]|jgi:ComEC/Rec2-related protein|nr:ComEC/Rec2 family competence protein [Patescibacteria group bacterium]